MTLPEFLLARINEDDQEARAATAGPWEWQTFHGVDELVHPVSPGGGMIGHPWNVLKSSHEDWPPNPADAAHIARWDPARALAEVAAKRAVLDLLDIAQQHFRSIHLGAADYADVQRAQVPRDALLRAVQALALPYADHPDYDQAWRLA